MAPEHVLRATVPPLRLYLAASFWQRAAGLFLYPQCEADGGLWLRPCRAIHTVGLGRAIDVVFLDRQGRVLKTVQALRPYRLAWCWRAYSVVELPAHYCCINKYYRASLRRAIARIEFCSAHGRRYLSCTTTMNKAFVKESDNDDDDDLGPEATPLPAGTKNYITVDGYARLRAELEHLMNEERPNVVQVVSWAASNGDRSENGDYLYGKKRLREIDRRIRFLTKRLEMAEVVDPSQQPNKDQVFFGATVVYSDKEGEEFRVTIVGVDEAEPLQGRISWISPVARALTKAREGDTVTLRTPAGVDELDILEVHYPQAG